MHQNCLNKDTFHSIELLSFLETVQSANFSLNLLAKFKLKFAL